MIGIEPSLLTAGISDEDAQTLATSSMTMTVATASAPAPSYASAMCTAWKPAAVSAFCASTGYRSCSSTSAACGGISPSAISRIASRTAWWSSVSVNSSLVTVIPSVLGPSMRPVNAVPLSRRATAVTKRVLPAGNNRW